MKLSRFAAGAAFFAGVAGAGPAASGPFYFSSIDYNASATAAVVSANNTFSDSHPAIGFQQSTDHDLAAATAPLAYVSPDGISFGTAFMDASGHVGPGLVGVDLHGTASAQSNSGDFFNDIYGASGSSSATVDDRWMDQFTLDVPGHAPGEPFTVHANLQLDGAASFQFSANLHDGTCGAAPVPGPYEGESYFGSLDIRGTGVPLPPSSQQGHWGLWRGQRSFGQGELVSANIDPPETIGWEQPVYQDQVSSLFIELVGGLTANAAVDGCASNLEAAGITDALTYAHTLSWGGITSITDSLGNPVTDYTLTSLSGFDYRYAATEVSPPGPPGSVPEPGTIVLLALAGLIARRIGRPAQAASSSFIRSPITRASGSVEALRSDRS